MNRKLLHLVEQINAAFVRKQFTKWKRRLLWGKFGTMLALLVVDPVMRAAKRLLKETLM
jgi:hypothetical protein